MTSSSLTAMCTQSMSIFFFFQAEDGIRDIGVTGVQTCALPIFHCRRAFQGTTASVHAANYFSGPPGGRGRQRTSRLMEFPGPARRASGRRLSAALSQVLRLPHLTLQDFWE